jgi:hypothetical protein
MYESISAKNALCHAALFLLLGATVLAFTIGVASASVFDGTYDYRYNLYGPNGWETHDVSSGLIISNGKIYSNPAAFSGSVNSNGEVHFTGPCPYGDPTATFTGSINSDGTGSGKYSCPYNHAGGNWAVRRVSGGSSSTSASDGENPVISFFAGIGGILGLSESAGTNAAIGIVMIVFPIVIVAQALTMVLRKQRAQLGIKSSSAKPSPKMTKQRTIGYAASEANPPSQTLDAPPPISPGGQAVAGTGISFDTTLPSSLNLKGKWTKNQVDLQWKPPNIDPSKYQLEGYNVYAMQYGPSSTTPTNVQVAKLPPNTTQWSARVSQTYRWNTSGDINGYMVEALIRRQSSEGATEILRITGISHAPPL